MRYRNHRYITDGIVYNTYVFHPSGEHIRVSEVYEIWTMQKSTRTFPEILSYDNGYTSSKILDVRVCGSTELMALHTMAGRQQRVPLDSYVMTDRGYVKVRDLGIETPLMVVDNYKNFYGDHIALRTNGNSRVRALLRNHGIRFETNEYGGTVTERGTIYCVDFDKDTPSVSNGVITVGLNNWRETVKQIFKLPDFTFDKVAKIEKGKDQYTIAIKLEGPQTIVGQNGLLIQSTQEEIRDDW